MGQLAGFKGYLFDAHEQPAFTLEWQPLGTGTQYTLFRKGTIGPVSKFYITRSGQRLETDTRPRSWIENLYARYPRLDTLR